MRISAEVRAALGREQVGGFRFPPQHRPGSEGLSSLALPSQFVKDPHRINSCLPETCIVTNPNKSQSLFLSASSGQLGFKGSASQTSREDWPRPLRTPQRPWTAREPQPPLPRLGTNESGGSPAPARWHDLPAGVALWGPRGEKRE